jgi:hypothetical protein
MRADRIFDAFEALDDLYVQKDIYRDTQLRLDSGVDNPAFKNNSRTVRKG